jgi:hypothetical protein
MSEDRIEESLPVDYFDYKVNLAMVVVFLFICLLCYFRFKTSNSILTEVIDNESL